MAGVFFMCKYMGLKSIYAGKPASFQLFVLLLLVLAGATLSSMLATGIFFLSHGLSADITQYPDMMRFLQLISALGTFLFPALAVAWLCGDTPGQYLSVGDFPGKKMLILTAASMLLLSPAISLTALLNKQMELPAFMAPIENWMKVQEEVAEKLTLLLLSGKGFLTLISNLIVIAVVASITEEFLFRGAIQRILGGWTRNHHLIIWSAAFLFSAFHLQFYGFLPRLLLGAYFGYLLYWSKNIWIPVFAHFINNAFAVIGMSSKLKENEFITGDISNAHILPYSILAITMLAAFYYCVKQIRSQLTVGQS